MRAERYFLVMGARQTSDGYEGRIGRYGGQLAQALIPVSLIAAGQRVLEVGCGSGALTVHLTELTAPENVVGLDPDPDALAACGVRAPGVELVQGWAEELPFDENSFDAVISQLVVGLMSDPPAGVREMRRVARPGAPVTSCVWDFAEGMTVLRRFWDAGHAVDADAAAKFDQAATHAYSTPKGLRGLWDAAGFIQVNVGALTATAQYVDFDDLWQPMTVPDGAPGRFIETLSAERQGLLREELRRRLDAPDSSFELEARAWYVTGRA
jgi:SAM-dependent methyltransferase